MARDLTNKVVVITGGAEGIGYEVADRYLQKGARIIILLDINEKLGAEAVKKLTAKHGNKEAIFLKCDVTTDVEAVSAVTNQFAAIYTAGGSRKREHMVAFPNKTPEGFNVLLYRLADYDYSKLNFAVIADKVDILLNNAGILNDALLKKTIDINVTAVLECGLKFWEHMRTDKGGNGGTIINLASIYGFRIDQFLPVYQASKYAVMGFTKSLGHAANFKRSGVRVVAMCPGFTETKLTAQPIMWDLTQNGEFSKFLKAQLWQKVDAVGNAAVEIFEIAESGTAWLIEGAKPIVEVAK